MEVGRGRAENDPQSIVNRVKEEVMEDSAEGKVTEGENGNKDKDKDADIDNS